MPYELPAHLQRLADQVPADIRAQLTDAELLARVSEAHRLERSASSEAQPLNHQLLTRRANTVLRALPADQVANEVARLRAVARNSFGRLSVGCYQRARELEQDNPQPTVEQLLNAQKTITAARSQRPPGSLAKSA